MNGAIERVIDRSETYWPSESGDPDDITAARAELAEMKAEIADLHAAESLAHESMILASVLYNQAHGITDGRWPDLGVLLHWFMDDRAAIRKALDLAWQWIDDTELIGALMIASLHGNTGSDRMRDLLAAARHEKDMVSCEPSPTARELMGLPVEERRPFLAKAAREAGSSKERAYIIRWRLPINAAGDIVSPGAQITLPAGVVHGRDGVGLWIEFEAKETPNVQDDEETTSGGASVLPAWRNGASALSATRDSDAKGISERVYGQSDSRPDCPPKNRGGVA